MDEMTPEIIAKKFQVEIRGLCRRYFQKAVQLGGAQQFGEAIASMLADLTAWCENYRAALGDAAGEVGG